MRTSEQLYHQVRWDPRFDPARFTLGLLQRGADPKRVPLPSFVPGGDIPWHRVLFVEADGELVWDRATGVDLIDTTPAGRVRERRLLDAPFFGVRTPHAWDPADGGAWRPARAGTVAAGLLTAGPVAAGPVTVRPVTAAPERVRLLTWNTLWDRYDAPLISTALRRPLLLADLAAADADVIALQEVEPALLKLVLAAPWVRDGYVLGTDPYGGDVSGCGLLLLSRLPVREAGLHMLRRHKGVAAITVDTAVGPLVVAATHLTSDHTENGAGRREEELARIAEGTAGLDADLALLGDFNDGRSGARGPAAALGLRDAWTEAHGADDDTPTFDPVGNPLAAVGSLTGRPGRLDRILLRSAAARVRAAGLRGDSLAPEGLFISDHYGVEATLEYAAVGEGPARLDAGATARTAVAWLPSADAAVAELRQRHDPAYGRWPAHVNLLFGFVPESSFDEALPLLAGVAAATEPFAARLEGVRSFGGREGATLWLDPAAAGEGPWQELRRALVERFPDCAGRSRGAGYTPHLTLGHSPDPRRAEREFGARLAGGRSAEVGRLSVLSRRGDGPMVVRATVELGTGEVCLLPEPSPLAAYRTDPWDGASAVRGGASTGRGGALPRRTASGPAGDGSPPERDTAPPERRTASPERDTALPEGDTALPGQGAALPRQGTALPGRAAPPLPKRPPQDERQLSVAAVVERVTAALGDGAVVRVAGSRRMACAPAWADLDLVALVPGDPGAGGLRERVAAALPEAERLREVTGARVPGLRLRLGQRDVDLVVVATGGTDPASAVARRAELGGAAAVALSALSDADAVRESVGAERAAFSGLALAVKSWARARGLDSAPFGGLPGLAWAVLAARTVRTAPDLGPTALLREFFGTWAAWDWNEPVELLPTGRRGEGPAPVTVLTPSEPVRSCTAQVGAGLRDLLVRELYRAWEVLDAEPDGFERLLSAPPLHRRHAAWAVVTVRGDGPREFEDNLGRARGRLRSLLGALEEAGAADAHAWPRPFELSDTLARYAVGLGAAPPDAGRLEALTAAWCATLPGVEVDRAACGEVPDLI
ncbi:RNA repair domain-containing protein [Streptomyces sp. DK15]|uniref:poly(A) polymerase n=1 Tax=Streptomyces sp. DK15 TaxID=2957499 RepID=UPI0029BE12C6|nr:poly(A) polymerase [Streptomyces sp. DK15]MDX2390507.1 RNA repair domain-containing protein [Streptomyces sp. DK15]